MFGELIVACGVGDLIAFDSFLSFEQKRSFERIYYANRTASMCRSLLETIPHYASAAHEILYDFEKEDPGVYCFDSREHLATVLDEPIPPEMMITNFCFGLPYQGSSFIDYQLGSLDLELPERYVVIHPFSGLDWRYPKSRNFTLWDWERVIKRLSMNTPGVVLGSGEFYVPDHPLLANLSNVTSVLESAEIVKRASGYLGIDSWLAALAAKVPSLETFKVKSVNPDFEKMEYRCFYYSPRTPEHLAEDVATKL